MKRSTRLMAVSAAAASTIALSAPAVGASTHEVSATASAQRAALAALRHVFVNPPPASEVRGIRHGVRGLSKVKFTNWAGYADDGTKGNTYAKVSGDWTEPAVTCPTKENQLTVFWVGIDGFPPSTTVEQDGTIAECLEGSAHYFTWWEMYPTNDIQVVGTRVKPGDKIAASVVRTGTSYALKLTDSTTSGNNVSVTQSCAASKCKNSSAEWIAEAPGGPRGEYPLADFHTWSLSSASVTSSSTKGSIKTFPDDEITMYQGFPGGYALATPGPLNAAATGFSVTWDNSY